MDTKTPPPAVVTLTAGHFRALVGPVVPLALNDRYNSTPILQAVYVRSSGPYLTATATDRYRMGVKRLRTAETPPAGISAVMPLTTVKRILTAFKVSRSHNPELRLTFGPDTVKVESGFAFADGGEAALTLPLVTDKYPPVDRLIREAMGREVAAESFAVNPAFLGDFRHAQQMGEPLVIKSTGRTHSVVVHVGEDFIGLIQPVRFEGDDERVAALDTGWADLLDAPAEEKAA
ncbi:hypothetical protein [Occultella kanbiaonis]|uniref:DNA polymerase III subunit beta family protein n=1 Tax=Occultella kanbiaonis TaxID=2675754 RepID=UPI0013D4DF9F|nr:hypothetical protein [Occultella kanbiaonis]